MSFVGIGNPWAEGRQTKRRIIKELCETLAYRLEKADLKYSQLVSLKNFGELVKNKEKK